MPKSLLKLKNYEVHSITTVSGDKMNANIATWMMQVAMGGKMVCVALYKVDYTIQLVQQSKILNINLLSTKQTGLIPKLGRKSGRDTDKFKNLKYALDDRGCPYLTEAIGYIQCKVLHSTDAGDHELFICEVIKQVSLNTDETVMTHHFLREKGLVRG